MGPLTSALTKFFSDEEWEFQPLEDGSILRLAFSGDSGHWNCLAQAREVQQQLVMYSICPLRVPEARRQAMAEFLTRANYGIVVGNFELDFDDGEIRYKTSLDVEEAEPTPPLLRHIVYANVSAMDRYLPGIMAVIAGSRTPAEAAADIDDARAPDLSKS